VSYYLGIDGGGTKTTAVVGDETRVLARATAGPSNIVRVGAEQARISLEQCVRQACAGAGIVPEQISHTCVGAAGAARPELADVVRKILSEVVAGPIGVVGDMETALEAAFGQGPGVVVNAGTGSFAYGGDSQGNTARAGGWGFAIGDEGSAHWIGRMTVSALLRDADEDPGVADSAFARALEKAWGVSSLLDLARAANAVPPPDFAALFPVVAASAEKIAHDVLAKAGRELARVAEIVIRRLFADGPGRVPVARSGGVFRHAAIVGDIFYNELRRMEPRAEVSREIVDPVDGALRMARRGGFSAASQKRELG